ncbi:uroporphyrinogen-III synthase [Halopiger aswanensis]|uniref:Uroporphyrinogen-III synthase n=1 Tax=Halopiger aswanensis TaxID=148449 RepID=A0A419VZA6_9EURY|nr:uroporphyrinogen-III synthase [Halopiger aswanensis]RKD88568.1 uroporphyrinogen-III synthase [Halopiger aswanensis]
MSKPKVAALRPDDTRIDEAVQCLQSLGVSPVADPMLTICPTGQRPRQAEYCIFTSKTGVELAVEHGWHQDGETVCAVGRQTATALQNHGYSVDVLPSTFTSEGLVKELAGEVEGNTVEIVRSAHGSDVLIQGLEDAGAAVHETQLYRLKCPSTAGQSISLAVDGELDGILFTSPKTVDHFFKIATERDVVAALRCRLEETVVGAIGPPTERAVRKNGGTVNVIPDTVDFTRLAEATVNHVQGRQ